LDKQFASQNYKKKKKKKKKNHFQNTLQKKLPAEKEQEKVESNT
jgi:hypothetical protein